MFLSDSCSYTYHKKLHQTAVQVPNACRCLMHTELHVAIPHTVARYIPTGEIPYVYTDTQVLPLLSHATSTIMIVGF